MSGKKNSSIGLTGMCKINTLKCDLYIQIFTITGFSFLFVSFIIDKKTYALIFMNKYEIFMSA
jgi:hypothetical protein